MSTVALLDATEFASRFPEVMQWRDAPAGLPAGILADGTLTNDYINAKILEVQEEYGIATARWGACAPVAVAQLLAHELTLFKRRFHSSNIQGPVTSRSVSGISLTVGARAPSTERSGYLNASVYGQKFLMLEKLYVPGVAIAR